MPDLWPHLSHLSFQVHFYLCEVRVCLESLAFHSLFSGRKHSLPFHQLWVMRNVYYAEERNQTVLYNPHVDLCVQAKNTCVQPLKLYKLVYLSCRSVRIHTEVLFPFPVNLWWQRKKKKFLKHYQSVQGVVGSGLKQVAKSGK